MSFAGEFNEQRLDGWVRQSLASGTDAVRDSLARARVSLSDFAQLISPAGAELLEPLCRKSQALTRQRFGKVIRLFAPLYLSNECINNCKYCGFSRDNPILRVNLMPCRSTNWSGFPSRRAPTRWPRAWRGRGRDWMTLRV